MKTLADGNFSLGYAYGCHHNLVLVEAYRMQTEMACFPCPCFVFVQILRLQPGSILVCGPLHHHVLLSSIFGAVALFRSDMLLIFNIVWP